MIAERQVYELERTEIAKGAMGTALVVLGSVAIVERPSLSDRAEQLAVQKLIPWSRVKGFAPSILPGRSGLYEVHRHSHLGAPRKESVGDELRPAVSSKIGRSTTFSPAFLQSR